VAGAVVARPEAEIVDESLGDDPVDSPDQPRVVCGGGEDARRDLAAVRIRRSSTLTPTAMRPSASALAGQSGPGLS